MVDRATVLGAKCSPKPTSTSSTNFPERRRHRTAKNTRPEAHTLTRRLFLIWRTSAVTSWEDLGPNGIRQRHLFAIFQCEAQSTALFVMMPSVHLFERFKRSWTRRPLVCTFSHPLSINHHLHFCNHLGATKCTDHLDKMSKNETRTRTTVTAPQLQKKNPTQAPPFNLSHVQALIRLSGARSLPQQQPRKLPKKTNKSTDKSKDSMLALSAETL